MLEKIETYDEFKARYPRLIYNLEKWCGKNKKDASFYVQEIIKDLILKPKNFAQLEGALDFWSSEDVRIRYALRPFFRIPFPRFATEPELKSKWEAHWTPTDGNKYYTVDKEEIVETIVVNSEQVGVITINSYDAKVLNANNLMIVDVDFDNHIFPFMDIETPTKHNKQAIEQIIKTRTKQCLSVLKAFVKANSQYCFWAYRTKAGLRYIEVNQKHDPTSQRTKQILTQLYCDPDYIKLCHKQDCFRARLTPKPWRTQDESVSYRTCITLKKYGYYSDMFHPDESIQLLLSYHNEYTWANEADRINLEVA